MQISSTHAPNVLIYSIGRSAQRESLFKWVDVIASYDVSLYRLKSRSDIQVTQLDALSAGLYMAFGRQTPDDVVHTCRTALAGIKKNGTIGRNGRRIKAPA